MTYANISRFLLFGLLLFFFIEKAHSASYEEEITKINAQDYFDMLGKVSHLEKQKITTQNHIKQLEKENKLYLGQWTTVSSQLKHMNEVSKKGHPLSISEEETGNLPEMISLINLGFIFKEEPKRAEVQAEKKSEGEKPSLSPESFKGRGEAGESAALVATLIQELTQKDQIINQLRQELDQYKQQLPVPTKPLSQPLMMETGGSVEFLSGKNTHNVVNHVLELAFPAASPAKLFAINNEQQISFPAQERRPFSFKKDVLESNLTDGFSFIASPRIHQRNREMFVEREIQTENLSVPHMISSPAIELSIYHYPIRNQSSQEPLQEPLEEELKRLRAENKELHQYKERKDNEDKERESQRGALTIINNESIEILNKKKSFPNEINMADHFEFEGQNRLKKLLISRNTVNKKLQNQQLQHVLNKWKYTARLEQHKQERENLEQTVKTLQKENDQLQQHKDNQEKENEERESQKKTLGIIKRDDFDILKKTKMLEDKESQTDFTPLVRHDKNHFPKALSAEYDNDLDHSYFQNLNKVNNSDDRNIRQYQNAKSADYSDIDQLFCEERDCKKNIRITITDSQPNKNPRDSLAEYFDQEQIENERREEFLTPHLSSVTPLKLHITNKSIYSFKLDADNANDNDTDWHNLEKNLLKELDQEERNSLNDDGIVGDEKEENSFFNTLINDKENNNDQSQKRREQYTKHRNNLNPHQQNINRSEEHNRFSLIQPSEKKSFKQYFQENKRNYQSLELNVKQSEIKNKQLIESIKKISVRENTYQEKIEALNRIISNQEANIMKLNNEKELEKNSFLELEKKKNNILETLKNKWQDEKEQLYNLLNSQDNFIKDLNTEIEDHKESSKNTAKQLIELEQENNKITGQLNEQKSVLQKMGDQLNEKENHIKQLFTRIQKSEHESDSNANICYQTLTKIAFIKFKNELDQAEIKDDFSLFLKINNPNDDLSQLPNGGIFILNPNVTLIAKQDNPEEPLIKDPPYSHFNSCSLHQNKKETEED